jgi:hypothetical protein
MVAARIRATINSDPSLSDWYESVGENYQTDEEWPSDLFDSVQKIISSDTALTVAFRGIVFNDDAPENEATLYELIFCPSDPIDDCSPDGDIPLTLEEAEPLPEEEEGPVIALQDAAITRIAEVHCVSPGVAFLVLRHFGWNADEATVALCESRASVLASLGIPESRATADRALVEVSGSHTCEICFLDCDIFLALPCGHAFCPDCWAGHAESQLSSGAVRCPEGCDNSLTPADVLALCGPTGASVFRRALLSETVRIARTLLQCGGLNCSRVLTLANVGLCWTAECECGWRQCWLCGQPPHAPCSCHDVTTWERMRADMLDRYRAQLRWQRREIRLLEDRRNRFQYVHTVFQQHIGHLKHRFQLERMNEPRQHRKRSATEARRRQILQETEHEAHVLIEIYTPGYAQEEEKRRQKRHAELVANAWAIERSKNQVRTVSLMLGRRATTEDLLRELTRTCPKCHIKIQKNGGCNHMTCVQCGTEFCWVCGEKWASHKPQTCSLFDPEPVIQTRDQQERVARHVRRMMTNDVTVKSIIELMPDDGSEVIDLNLNDTIFQVPPLGFEARQEFNRLMHFNDRFICHAQSKTAEEKQQLATQARIIAAWNRSQPNEVSIAIMKRAYRAMRIARETLMWSYPYAFLLTVRATDPHMFEIRQADLEILMEKVASIIEHFDGETPDVFERFVVSLEKHIDAMLREADSLAVDPS